MSNLKNHYIIVQNAIKNLGVDPASCQVTDEPGSWCLVKGSAEVIIQIYVNHESNIAYFRVQSAFMAIPADVQLRVEFYEELLSISMEYVGITFGKRESMVYIKSEREAQGLDTSEVLMMIKRVGYVCDQYDDLFKRKYGGAS
jgi:hypothetical protein